MFNSILIASDGSECALRAARVAGDLAKSYGSTVTVVQVSVPSSVTEAQPQSVAPEVQAAAGEVELAQNSVSRRTGRVLDEFGVSYTIRQEVGQPSDMIVRVAREAQTDLIVLGSRGQSAIQSLLLGSVSDGVVHHAHCPVLIVK